MAFEIKGTIIEIYDVVQPTGNFRKREFVVEKKENNGGMEFTDYIKFQLIQDKCSLIDGYQVNDPVSVSFNIRGNRWEKDGKVNYFTNLTAWKIERDQVDHSEAPDVPLPGQDDIPPASEENSLDDLPF